MIARWRANPLWGQLLRFGVSGVLASLVYAAVYLPLSAAVLPHALAWVAVLPAFAAGATVGFVLHSRWSFRDHGARDRGSGQRVGFVAVQGAGMALNMLYAWGLCDLLHQPPWTALVPAVTVTPLVTFFLNRQLVFA